MARFGAQWDDYEQDRDHRERVIAKRQRIDMLQSLLQMWEERDNGNDDTHEYVLKLRARLRAAQNQLEAMAV